MIRRTIEVRRGGSVYWKGRHIQSLTNSQKLMLGLRGAMKRVSIVWREEKPGHMSRAEWWHVSTVQDPDGSRFPRILCMHGYRSVLFCNSAWSELELPDFGWIKYRVLDS